MTPHIVWLAAFAISALVAHPTLAMHCPFQTVWGHILTVGGEFPEEFIELNYGDLAERCELTLADRPTHLEGVSGWLPAGQASCNGWTTQVTFLAPEDGEHLSIAVFEGNVFYAHCPPPGRERISVGALRGPIWPNQ